MGRLSPEGGPVLGLRYVKGYGFHRLRFSKREVNLLFNYYEGLLITCKIFCTLWLYHFISQAEHDNFPFWKFILNMDQL